MKSIFSSTAIVTLIMFVSLLIVAVVAFPMHIGEPSYYHTARVDCRMAATAYGLVAIVSAITSAHF